MRPIDADELMEHVYRDRLDSRELIAQMVENSPTIHPEPDFEWRKKHYKIAYNQGFVDGCKSYEKQLERKTGHWIFIHPLQEDDQGGYMCSVCKNGDWDIKPTDKYCKFCGAKM